MFRLFVSIFILSAHCDICDIFKTRLRAIIHLHGVHVYTLWWIIYKLRAYYRHWFSVFIHERKSRIIWMAEQTFFNFNFSPYRLVATSSYTNFEHVFYFENVIDCRKHAAFLTSAGSIQLKYFQNVATMMRYTSYRSFR